jgi:hypothetical protein
MKKMITVVVMCVALVVGAAAQAGTIVYTEGFDDGGATNRTLDTSSTGWDGSNNIEQRYDGTMDYSSDGDSYWVHNSGGNSGSKHAISTAGEYTITGLAILTLDWAANTTMGMRIMAEVDGQWYGSAQLGTGADDHGAMTTSGVTSWQTDSISVDGTWYASLAGLPADGDAYAWRDDIQWSTTPLSGLPAGDVTRFGIGWLHTGNTDFGAVDNVRVEDGGPAATLGTLFLVK